MNQEETPSKRNFELLVENVDLKRKLDEGMQQLQSLGEQVAKLTQERDELASRQPQQQELAARDREITNLTATLKQAQADLATQEKEIDRLTKEDDLARQIEKTWRKYALVTVVVVFLVALPSIASAIFSSGLGSTSAPVTQTSVVGAVSPPAATAPALAATAAPAATADTAATEVAERTATALEATTVAAAANTAATKVAATNTAATRAAAQAMAELATPTPTPSVLHGTVTTLGLPVYTGPNRRNDPQIAELKNKTKVIICDQTQTAPDGSWRIVLDESEAEQRTKYPALATPCTAPEGTEQAWVWSKYITVAP
jgi:hypothetical protein